MVVAVVGVCFYIGVADTTGKTAATFFEEKANEKKEGKQPENGLSSFEEERQPTNIPFATAGFESG